MNEAIEANFDPEDIVLKDNSVFVEYKIRDIPGKNIGPGNVAFRPGGGAAGESNRFQPGQISNLRDSKLVRL